MSSILPTRNPYPSDASGDEWAFVALYLVLLALASRHQRMGCWSGEGVHGTLPGARVTRQCAPVDHTRLRRHDTVLPIGSAY